MGKILARYLEYRRGDHRGYRYRRVIPPELRQHFDGRKQWIHTLSVRHGPAEACAWADRLTIKYDAQLEQARNGDGVSPEQIAENERTARSWLSEPAHKRSEVVAFLEAEQTGEARAGDRVFLDAPQHGGEYRPTFISIRSMHELDKERYGGTRDEKPFNAAVASFVEFMGRDANALETTPTHAEDWVSWCLKRKQAPSTVQRRLNALRAMYGRLWRRNMVSRPNPWERVGVKGGADAKDARQNFHSWHLSKIDSYVAGSTRLKPDTRAALVIMRHTTLGPGELSGVTLADVVLDHPVPHIVVRDNHLRNVKEKPRDRIMPLVGPALEEARAAAERARRREKGVPADKVRLLDLGDGTALSASLNKTIRRAGVPKSKRLTCYSFRHSMKDALEEAHGLQNKAVLRLMGRTAPGVDGQSYGAKAMAPDKLRDALSAALPYLGDVAVENYTAAELPADRV